jgi:hypothetical protein
MCPVVRTIREWAETNADAIQTARAAADLRGNHQAEALPD